MYHILQCTHFIKQPQNIISRAMSTHRRTTYKLLPLPLTPELKWSLDISLVLMNKQQVVSQCH